VEQNSVLIPIKKRLMHGLSMKRIDLNQIIEKIKRNMIILEK